MPSPQRPATAVSGQVASPEISWPCNAVVCHGLSRDEQSRVHRKQAPSSEFLRLDYSFIVFVHLELIVTSSSVCRSKNQSLMDPNGCSIGLWGLAATHSWCGKFEGRCQSCRGEVHMTWHRLTLSVIPVSLDFEWFHASFVCNRSKLKNLCFRNWIHARHAAEIASLREQLDCHHREEAFQMQARLCLYFRSIASIFFRLRCCKKNFSILEPLRCFRHSSYCLKGIAFAKLFCLCRHGHAFSCFRDSVATQLYSPTKQFGFAVMLVQL